MNGRQRDVGRGSLLNHVEATPALRQRERVAPSTAVAVATQCDVIGAPGPVQDGGIGCVRSQPCCCPRRVFYELPATVANARRLTHCNHTDSASCLC